MFLYLNFLNFNEPLFYTLIKILISLDQNNAKKKT